MKYKKITILLILLLALTLSSKAFALDNGGKDIEVYVNGEIVQFDSRPIIDLRSQRTLVPFRAIFEALGTEVEYDEQSRTAIGIKGDVVIKLPIGQAKGFVNDKEIPLDVASQIRQGRTLVPLRFIGESLGCTVEADNQSGRMVINIELIEEVKPKTARTVENIEAEVEDDAVVLDLAVAEGVNKVFTLSNPNRLVIDLEDATIDTEGISEIDSDLVFAVRVGQFEETVARVVVDLKQAVTYQLQQGKDSLKVTLAADKGQDIERDYNTIVIDPGHGGRDPGAISPYTGRFEKEFCTALAQLVADLLEDEGFDVIMTRSGDEYVSLEERVRLANSTNAFAFVSIHANSAPNTEVSGVEVYTKRGSDRTFARITADAIVKRSGQNNRGAKEADFYVIRHTGMPAILIEAGFLTNVQEEQYLYDPRNQEVIAQGIVDGILEYRDRVAP
ncbi:N-acetylmuramoyl-L-alanine amidase family protein [Desulfofalx alkaliphila]|uniref:N-acetylmuramoyl-L-alanine amidase family protein n=1 Tax=Desulfofalx alkaliphila TaxID=105483 RepID=UPI00146FC09B|nr:N-acetylmuramoyl-L-alanine amidase family protein [Desulfofalx alkaliphila]